MSKMLWLVDPAGFPGGAVLRGNVRGLLLTACYPGISCDVKDSFGQLQGLCDGKNFTIKNSGWSRQNSTSCGYAFPLERRSRWAEPGLKGETERRGGSSPYSSSRLGIWESPHLSLDLGESPHPVS